MNENKNNLNLTYDWYSETVGKAVNEAVSSFFENKFDMFLISVNDFASIKDDPILKNDLFYTCQISIKNKQNVISRLSSDFIRIIFHDLFGSNLPVFDLEKLSDLERKILEGFFEHVVGGLENILINDKEINKIDPLLKTNLNFVFLVKNKNVTVGKLCLNIPLNRLQPKPVTLVQNFSDEEFIKTSTEVDIIAGHARISLEDLKSLNKDDILVLEKSDIKTMTLKTNNKEEIFKVNPEPSIMIDLDGEDEETEITEEYKEYVMVDTKSVWDDIQIDVSAEFQKVKMTLGELKQISKGLVIDLGPVMKNEISLLVENKVVAKGEIVIINDKYGVKINEVYSSKKEEAPQAKPQTRPQAQAPEGVNGNVPPKRPIPSRPTPSPRPQAPQAQAKEDFDYSNFEE